MTRAQKQGVMSLEGQSTVIFLVGTFSSMLLNVSPTLFVPQLDPFALPGPPTSLVMSSKPITAECTTDSAMAVTPIPHLLRCPASRRCSS